MKEVVKGAISLPDFLSVEDPTKAVLLTFVLVVTISAIFPRMPFDTPWEIGGNLSKPFRYMVVAIFVTNFVRHTTPRPYYIWADAVLTVLCSCTFLMTPYLLRVWLSKRVNIGTRSGEVFTRWVKAVAILSCLGAVLRYRVDRKYWLLTKIADALTFFPVTRTLALYNSVTLARSRYPGRGSILSQTAMILEWCSLFAHGADAASKILGLMGLVDRTQLNSKTSPTMMTVYFAIRYITFLRLFCHSILLNSLDEAYTIGSVATSDHDVPHQQPSSSQTNEDADHSARPLVETITDDEDEEEGMAGLD
jgi:hypothetical protein